MLLLVVIGGAYSGKRKYVREQCPEGRWFSAYDGCRLEDSKGIGKGQTIILEGFEVWLEELIRSEKDDDDILRLMKDTIASLHDPVLIMLEVGRGIVPVKKEDRRLRDLMGWLQQHSVGQADRAVYIWHGLARAMK